MRRSQIKLIKGRISSVARVVACASFLILTIIGVSSLVKAMTLQVVAHQGGVPASWKAASLGNPETITVPITYWDQQYDPCSMANRQFEWTLCNGSHSGAMQGIVKNQLGADGLPIPKYATSAAARAGGIDATSLNVLGQDPVQPGDNFYRWFHEVPGVSKRYDRELTFKRVGNNSYTYGGSYIFPLDDASPLNSNDKKLRGDDGISHNFHFTARLSVPVKIDCSDIERFEFSGDDDVWVFLNNQLVLDIGGLHGAVAGWFAINKDGTITSYVEGAGYKTLNIGIKKGDVTNLDFFYAERSTGGSNTLITIKNMNWPITADSDIQSQVMGKIGNSDSNLIQNVASITNRDPINALTLERVAAFVRETEYIKDARGNITEQKKEGFLPLSNGTLFYTNNPGDISSWTPIEVSAPSNDVSGFNLATPLRIAPNGQAGDTLYFRFFTETSEFSGDMTSQFSYYTTLGGDAGVSYDYKETNYTSEKTLPPVDYDVTINYIYEDGSEALPTRTEIIKIGDKFNFESPEIEGFVPNIASIAGVVESSHLEFTVIYKEFVPEPEIPKHIVTVNYLYPDGSEAAVSVSAELDEGAEYSFASPVIEGYTPDQLQVEGIVGPADATISVTYTKDPEPEPIVPEPEVPETPEEPELPEIPVVPPSDNIGGDLVYIAPLGQVAYVPNTGIIGKKVAEVFEETFAETMMSQTFVMATLLVFAASFAVYFTYRKYRNTETEVKKPVKKTYAKSAQKMPVKKATKKPIAKPAKKATKTAKKTKK